MGKGATTAEAERDTPFEGENTRETTNKADRLTQA